MGRKNVGAAGESKTDAARRGTRAQTRLEIMRGRRQARTQCIRQGTTGDAKHRSANVGEVVVRLARCESRVCKCHAHWEAADMGSNVVGTGSMSQ